eukprot:c698_g1_i1.p1 GENE.c698_g1_i1~~c698_g1_i1.p1  ORF type:complete len:160 (+),score=28.70 c698_g1_i1:274-753(+)
MEVIDMVVVLAPQRHTGAQGELQLPPGTAILTWDNTFSWLTAKTITYETILTTTAALDLQAESLARRKQDSRRQHTVTTASNRLAELKTILSTCEGWLVENEHTRASLLGVMQELESLGTKVVTQVQELDEALVDMTNKVRSIQCEVFEWEGKLGDVAK